MHKNLKKENIAVGTTKRKRGWRWREEEESQREREREGKHVNLVHGFSLVSTESERGVGFLYLRYVADPKTLWSWFEPHIKDDEEFSPGSNGRMTTMGVYIRDLLLGQILKNVQMAREVGSRRRISSDMMRIF
ncbi:pre-mRNA splicing factor SR-like 1 [Lotus japonicus]|uniref:pre-mRNA splicing factor SR-like 1 n=1 Tax=Lotus japonicus TaxID=34305 RepID=UPI00258BF987|nr:pre-mRNA splicing factor SR-like 1 [Lotus japonicus]